MNDPNSNGARATAAAAFDLLHRDVSAPLTKAGLPRKKPGRKPATTQRKPAATQRKRKVPPTAVDGPFAVEQQSATAAAGASITSFAEASIPSRPWDLSDPSRPASLGTVLHQPSVRESVPSSMQNIQNANPEPASRQPPPPAPQARSVGQAFDPIRSSYDPVRETMVIREPYGTIGSPSAANRVVNRASASPSTIPGLVDGPVPVRSPVGTSTLAQSSQPTTSHPEPYSMPTSPSHAFRTSITNLTSAPPSIDVQAAPRMPGAASTLAQSAGPVPARATVHAASEKGASGSPSAAHIPTWSTTQAAAEKGVSGSAPATRVPTWAVAHTAAEKSVPDAASENPIHTPSRSNVFFSAQAASHTASDKDVSGPALAGPVPAEKTAHATSEKVAPGSASAVAPAKTTTKPSIKPVVRPLSESKKQLPPPQSVPTLKPEPPQPRPNYIVGILKTSKPNSIASSSPNMRAVKDALPCLPGDSSNPLDFGKNSPGTEASGTNIVLRIALNGETNKYVNFMRIAEDRYGWDALHPRAAAQRDRRARIAAATSALAQAGSGRDSGDEMSDDVSEGDNSGAAGLTSGADAKPVKKKRNFKEDEYDKEDDFVDDSELLWEEQAAASRDGFFVYSGPLVPEAPKPLVYVIFIAFNRHLFVPVKS